MSSESTTRSQIILRSQRDELRQVIASQEAEPVGASSLTAARSSGLSIAIATS